MDYLMGIGLSSSTGYKPFIPLLIISIAAKLEVIELYRYNEWLSSYIFILIILVLIILEFLSTSIPYLGKVFEVIGIPISIICGFLAITSLIGSSEEEYKLLNNLIGIFLGSGSAAIVKITTLVKNSIVDTATFGLSSPINSIKDSIKAFLTSIISIVAPIFVVVFLLIFIFFTYKTIKIIKQKRNIRNHNNYLKNKNI